MTDTCFMLTPPEPLIVFNCCERDLQMQIKALTWMRELDGQQAYTALLMVDEGCNGILAREVEAAAQAAFQTLVVHVYPRPPMPRWPWAANWVFQSTAWAVNQVYGRPWFWCEADAVPLRTGWLADWFAAYRECRRPIMGSVVEGRGHCNGTAIYPADFAQIAPAAMKATDVAWDWVMREETIGLTHHTRLLQHCWGIEHGQPHPYNGNAPSFIQQRQVDQWVRPDAVLFHRSKDGTLIDRLRERRAAAGWNRNSIPAGGGGGMLTP